MITHENKLFVSANEFSIYIEQYAHDNEITCMQALLDYCDENDLEYEEIARIISKSLKEKLAIEFADIGLLKKNASLEE